MGKQSHAGDPSGAITRVLSAEREARLAIEEAEAEAERLFTDARSRARGIVRTTQRRISRLHGVCGQAVEQRVRELEGAESEAGPDTLPADTVRMRLREAAAEAARVLTTQGGAVDVD